MSLKFLVATHNAGKVEEFRRLFGALGVEVVSAGELGLAEPEETGATFAENARLKARAAAAVSGLVAVADDSGLCVAALEGGPGVYSARYAAGDYPAAFARIIAAADANGERRARFVCALCVAWPDGQTATYVGQADGAIAAQAAGAGGFGYDAIFVPDGFAQTYAALGGEVKARESHRARAFAQVVAAFEALMRG